MNEQTDKQTNSRFVSLFITPITCGVSGVVEQEEKEEELCFLSVENEVI